MVTIGISRRYIHIRSPLKKEDSPMCLTDFASDSGQNSRPLVAMRCIDAITIGDGREIWIMDRYPHIKAVWDTRNMISFYDNEITGPIIRRLNDNNQDGILSFKNDNTITINRSKKCLKMNLDKEIKYHCSLNSNVTASSKKQIMHNDPCNPMLEIPKKFQFLPNDLTPSIHVTINMKYA